MSNESRILWTEGLFLCPQTFQQHDNFMLDNIESRVRPTEAYYWGIVELSIQESQLDNGIFSLKKCRGIFPDGTPFDISGNVLDLNISKKVQNKTIYLAAGARQPGVQEVVVEAEKAKKQTTRYVINETNVDDTHTIGNPVKTEQLQTGSLNFQLILADEPQNNFTQIALAFVNECDQNGFVKLSPAFIPPTLYSHAHPVIKNYIEMIQGQLSSRGEILANRLANPSTDGVSDTIDVNMLQIMNRHIPLFEFLRVEKKIHPKQLYIHALQLVGELSTFARKERRPLSYPEYIHDDLQLTFRKLFDDIHKYLQHSAIPKVLSIPLQANEEHHKTVHASTHLMHSVLTEHIRFVLAVSADIPLGDIQKAVTIASNLEHLQDLVRTRTPGIPFGASPSVPREIPYHSTCVYFDLDTKSSHWQKVIDNCVINVHVDRDIPNLKVKVWAIRGKTHEQ
ncbi:MAG: type VI secretion system baseplate subunit TssK [Thiotrichaceae bacterium]|nr:type VI secretion system baseplate subunit TssK [Thiotrichaceae bacterium]